MLTIYDWDASPNCLKTKILLLELGVPYDQKNVDRAFLQSADHRAKFPTGLAPAIEDGDVRISESGAIALYLAEKYGALVPKDPARKALMFQALLFEAALLSPTVGGQGLFGELYKPKAEQSEPRIAFLKQRAQDVAGMLGKILGDKHISRASSASRTRSSTPRSRRGSREASSATRRRTSSRGRRG